MTSRLRRAEQGGKLTFNPSIAREGDMSSYFCIFVEPNTICHNPVLRPIQVANMIRNHTLVFTEGGHNIDKLGNISAGSGVWYGHNDD
jgi:hypothetical protein